MYEVRRQPPLDNSQINALFSNSWPDHQTRDFQPILARSLSYLGSFAGEQLVGFLNIAWDGGAHGFIFDVTVAPLLRRHSHLGGVSPEAFENASKLAL
jgi:hypothetical protein